ncbi:metal ABC transporter ATP-binding protein [Enterococcus canis]|uniref:Metal ABC transporter ATP-binding protein n=1 Tax=Enterococcus canis TaxID=214095 RepID=A0A1L8RF63_9ENTE|nr:ATP-binding cassette domain-containing protein [Enterococcus canis]OJG18377.1 metal ABC transporter ATP-binding protein [Enterococcus canis]
MIELQNVSHYYPEKALDQIDLTIEDHEIFGIVGESGAGKSTLLRLLNLLEQPSEGKLLLAGTDVWQLSDQRRRQIKQTIGMVFQQYHLLHNRTIAENVGLPLKLLGKADPAKSQQLLEFVGLGDKAKSYPSQLSGGQKQRAAIARALITEPKIILCDEPTSALDEKNTLEILKLLKKVHATFQPTILFVSHELAAVKFLCQRAAVLEAGRLQAITAVQPAVLQDEADYTAQVIARLQA